MPNFTDLAKRQAELIRKPMAGVIATAPEETELLASFALTSAVSLTAPVTLTALTEWDQLGWVSKNDGVTFASDVQSEDVESWGAPEPTRTDIIRDVTSAQFTCQETNRIVLEMFHNVDLSGIVPAPNTGEVSFASATEPQTTYRRMLFLSKDGSPGKEFYIAKIMPRASVNAKADQQWGGSELNYGMTISAKVDDDLGYSVRHIFAGAGWRSKLVKMGFEAAVGTP